jgi:hypothetical protein
MAGIKVVNPSAALPTTRGPRHRSSCAVSFRVSMTLYKNKPELGKEPFQSTKFGFLNQVVRIEYFSRGLDQADIVHWREI